MSCLVLAVWLALCSGTSAAPARHLPLQRHTRFASRPASCGVPKALTVLGETSATNCRGSKDDASLRLASMVGGRDSHMGMRTIHLPILSLPKVSAENLVEVRNVLADVSDMMYTVTCEVGTPEQSVRLIIDTGSSNLFFKSNAYNWKHSSTGQRLGNSSVNLVFGRGEVQGYEIKDNFCINDLCFEQDMVVATSIRDIDGMEFFDGLLGLAYPLLAAGDKSGAFLETFANGHFTMPAFALTLHSFLSEKKGETSFISFGEVNDLNDEASKMGFASSATLEIIGVVLPGATTATPAYWMTYARFSSEPRSETSPQRRIQPTEVLVTFDSGSSLLVVPDPLLPTILQQILGKENIESGTCTLDRCMCNAEINSMIFDFQSVNNTTMRIELTKADLLFPMGTNKFGTKVCKVMVASAGSAMSNSLPMWVLGDVFLRRTHVVFDVKRMQVTLFGNSLLPQSQEGLISLRSYLPAAFVSIASISALWVAYHLGYRAGRPSVDARESTYRLLA